MEDRVKRYANLFAVAVHVLYNSVAKDTSDLTCSLALVLRPGTVKQRPFGKSYQHAFTGCVRDLYV